MQPHATTMGLKGGSKTVCDNISLKKAGRKEQKIRRMDEKKGQNTVTSGSIIVGIRNNGNWLYHPPQSAPNIVAHGTSTNIYSPLASRDENCP